MSVAGGVSQLDDAVVAGEPSPAAAEEPRVAATRRGEGAVFRRRGWLVRPALVAADLVGLTLALLAAQILFDPRGSPVARFDSIGPLRELALFAPDLDRRRAALPPLRS
jgi:hypothetical protein